MKVVIDTNIRISYLIGGLLKYLDEKIISNEVKIIVSIEMLKELSEVLGRPKFKNVFTVRRMILGLHLFPKEGGWPKRKK